MKKLILLTTMLSIAGITHTGLFVMIESPLVNPLVQENKDLIAQEIQDLNSRTAASETKQYIFEPDKWGAHITLAFIDQDPALKAEDAENKYPKIEQKLRLIAKKTSPITITDNIEESVIAYWPGAAPMMLGGSRKQNYITVVLKLGENRKLSDLADLITRQLEVAYGIKQRFTFSAHLMLGRIYEVNDAPVAPIVKELTTEPIVESSGRITVRAFKLKGAAGSEITFPFGPKKMIKRHQYPLERREITG